MSEKQKKQGYTSIQLTKPAKKLLEEKLLPKETYEQCLRRFRII
jgi:hypothetical protein